MEESTPQEVARTIDVVIASIQHPFFMVLFGLLFWFTLIWSLEMKKRKKLNLTFWGDQKDEIAVAIIGGLMFLVFDDEILQAFYDYKEIEGSPELKPYYYLLVAPVIDRLYWVVQKFRQSK
jgi:hypothetical protein